MNITVNVADLMTYDEDGEPAGPANFREAVERRAAEMMLSEMDTETKRTLRAELHLMVQEHAKTAIAFLVQQAAEQPIQRSTQWGERRGEPTTLLEIIREELERFLNATDGRRDAYDKTPHNLKQLVEILVREAITRDFSAEVKKAREQVTGKVKERAIAAAVAALNGER